MDTFTYTSIGVVIDHLLKKMSAIEIEHFFEKQGVPREIVQSAGCPSGKLACLRKIFAYLQTENRRDIIQKVVEDVLLQLWEPERPLLEKALLADGFTIIDGKLQAGPVEVEKERTALEVLIARTPGLSKDVLLHHLGENQDLYTKGKWDASIGQARNLIEQLLVDIATETAQRRRETPDLSRPVKVREYLVACGFLEDDERKRLVDGVYGYLSEQGSHPGISQQSVARISRILCLEMGQYLIEKLLTLV